MQGPKRSKTGAEQHAKPPTGSMQIVSQAIQRRMKRCRAASTPGTLMVAVAGTLLDRTEEGIVRIPLLLTAIEGLAIGDGERRVKQQPDHKIGVGDERLAERDQVGATFGYRRTGPFLVEIVVGNDDAAEHAFQRQIIERRHRRAG